MDRVSCTCTPHRSTKIHHTPREPHDTQRPSRTSLDSEVENGCPNAGGSTCRAKDYLTGTEKGIWLSVGGNDFLGSGCLMTQAALQGHVKGAIENVRAAAPKAHIVMTGYCTMSSDVGGTARESTSLRTKLSSRGLFVTSNLPSDSRFLHAQLSGKTTGRHQSSGSPPPSPCSSPPFPLLIVRLLLSLVHLLLFPCSSPLR
jgi:hypothetical protein